EPVQRHPGHLDRPPGRQDRQPGDVVGVVVAVRAVAHDHVLDHRRVDPRALGQRLQHLCQQLLWVEFVQATGRLALAARGAHPVDDPRFTRHGRHLPPVPEHPLRWTAAHRPVYSIAVSLIVRVLSDWVRNGTADPRRRLPGARPTTSRGARVPRVCGTVLRSAQRVREVWRHRVRPPRAGQRGRSTGVHDRPPGGALGPRALHLGRGRPGRRRRGQGQPARRDRPGADHASAPGRAGHVRRRGGRQRRRGDRLRIPRAEGQLMSSGDVWIVGTAMTRFGRFADKDLLDLAAEAALGALRDADMNITTIGALTLGNVYEANSHNGQRLQKQIGQTGIPVYNVVNACATGATAVRVALLSIAAGETDTALAVGVEKMGKMGLLGSAAKKRDAKKEYAPKGRYGSVIKTEGVLGTSLMPGVFAQ